MSSRAPLGLRSQIVLGLALVTLLAVLTTGYLALWIAGGAVRAQREGTALALATAAAAAAAAAIDRALPLDAPANRERLRATLRRLGDAYPELGLQVLTAGRQVALAVPERRPDDSDPPLLVGVLAGVPAAFNYRDRPGDGQTELIAYASLTIGDRVLGAVRVALPAPAPPTTVLAASGPILIGLAIADALLVVALGSIVLTRLVVRPLQAVERATTAVSAGDLQQRIEAEGPREVAALAAAFNQMTASLVTQREQLIRTEKLASVGQLAAGVAHEIGNPLAAVLGFVDILRADAVSDAGPGMTAAARRDALDRVKAETQRIHRIIQDLLAYSRPSREEAQATDPLAVLRAALELLGPQARFRGVKVDAEPAGEGAAGWPQAIVSPSRLTQVFVNLLLNAADAMGGDGRVAVRAAQRDGHVEISFADEGPGVPDDLAGKIFDPFFTTKPPGQGTGLGLAICRAIVESYGGRLELARGDRGRRGATFMVTLRAAPARGAGG